MARDSTIPPGRNIETAARGRLGPPGHVTPLNLDRDGVRVGPDVVVPGRVMSDTGLGRHDDETAVERV